MIKEIQVSGFKSLENFKVRLKTGLNVLVGPNGSGKTNVISFFEFLSSLANSDLSTAISSMGGAGSVFRREKRESFCKKISYYVVGSVMYGKGKYTLYKYSASILLSEETESVYYAEQRISIKGRTVDSEGENDLRGDWDFDVELKVDDQMAQSVIIHKFSKEKVGRFALRFTDKKMPFDEYARQFYSDFNGQEESILNSLRIYGDEYFSNVWHDFFSAKHYNLVPSKIRDGEDATSVPYIKKDGTGLSATLYAIKRYHNDNRRIKHHFMMRRRPYYDFERIKLSDIIQFVQLANKSIVDIDVNSNAFDNKLQVSVTLSEGGDGTCTLPMSTLSDGTIKWIALMTLLQSSKSIFAVEEPENFLHPSMQIELIKLMRSSVQDGGQILVSTHSETILNALKPDEVLILDFRDGRTTAKWVDGAEDLKSEIERTGFGLGYYYVSGGLQ